MMIKSMLGDRQFWKNLYRFALPIAIQSLMLAAVAAADAFMLGGVDQSSMSAVSFATQIQFIQNMIVSGVAGAAVILGAQYWGKGDSKTIGSIFCMSIRINGITSLLFFCGCIFIPQYLMALFTNIPELVDIGVHYLRIAGWSYLFTGISQCYLAIMKVTDHTSVTAKISSTTVIINIALNALFIFGFDMSIRGAAYATLIARIIELAWCVFLSFRKGYIRLNIPGLLKHYKLLEKDFVKCFLPLVGAGLLWGVGFTSYTAFMGHLGEDAAAANSIAAVVRDLVCCLCNGIAGGGGILVGNELGAGMLDKGKLYGDRLVIIAFIIGVASCLIMFALIPAIVSFVKLTEGAHEYMIQFMAVMAVYMIGRTVNTIMINGIFAAGGDTIFDMYSLVITMWMIAVPLAALGTFVFHWHPTIVYACTCLDEVGKIPWVIIHYRKYKWVKDLTRDTQAA